MKNPSEQDARLVRFLYFEETRENRQDYVRDLSMIRNNDHIINGAEPLSRGPWNTGARGYAAKAS